MSTETPTFFDHYARGNDLSAAGRRFIRPYYRKLFLPYLPKDRNARILDFGCGAGVLLDWLRSEGYQRVEGVDSDTSQITFANTLHLNAHWAANTTDWVEERDPYDLVFMTDVLEHIPDGEDLRSLRALYDAIVPGGTLIVKVPNANCSFATRRRYMDPTHHRVYTEETLRCALEGAGFRDIRITGDDLWAPRSATEVVTGILRMCFRAFRRIEAITEFGRQAASWPLSHNVVGIGRKPTS